nr:hypothetical protein [Fischerella thermalis]
MVCVHMGNSIYNSTELVGTAYTFAAGTGRVGSGRRVGGMYRMVCELVRVVWLVGSVSSK